MALADTILALAALLAVSVVAAGLLRRLPIPETVALVVIGIALGQAAGHFPSLEPLEALRLEPEVVFFVFLPALIFESGLDLDARQLARDLAPVLTLAVPALLLSAALVAAGLHLLLGMDLGAALVFGALISATDPVAVVALFKELGAPLRLTTLVEGESLLNDATAVVAVTVLLGILASAEVIDAATWVGAAAQFAWVFLGGAMLGLLFGIAASELAHRLDCEVEEVVVISIVTAYGSFVVAEHVAAVSGVMASGAAAVTFASYGASRVRAEASRATVSAWGLIARVFNAVLFILIGLALESGNLGRYVLEVSVAVALILLARAATVYTLTPLTARMFSVPRISLGERHLMFWGGLKGALAIAVALSLPADFPSRDLILHLTLGAVLFTLLVNAPTLRPLMTRLGLAVLDADDRAELDLALAAAGECAEREVRKLGEAGLLRRDARRRIARRVARAFEAERLETGKTQIVRAASLSLLRTEVETLRTVYDLGLVSQYTYLDMRNTLQLERERLVGIRGGGAQPTNPFVRLERALVRKLREHDRLAWLLARYQRMRLAQRARRDLAGVLTVRAALATLDGYEDLGDEARERLASAYHAHLDARMERIADLREQFPAFTRHLELVAGTRMALTAALAATEDRREHGEIGAKSYLRIRHAVEHALHALPRGAAEMPDPSPRELIASVPLFADLSESGLASIADHAHTVTFLPEDVLVGEGEHGDALYVIVAGEVAVVRAADSGRVAMLGPGDFFGEGALLGDSVRGASVRALTPVRVLRVSHDDVLRLAEREPEVGDRLRAARAARDEDAGDPGAA